MIYSGHLGCLAGQIILQGHAEKKRTLPGSDYAAENKKKRAVKTDSNKQTRRLVVRR